MMYTLADVTIIICNTLRKLEITLNTLRYNSSQFGAYELMGSFTLVEITNINAKYRIFTFYEDNNCKFYLCALQQNKSLN